MEISRKENLDKLSLEELKNVVEGSKNPYEIQDTPKVRRKKKKRNDELLTYYEDRKKKGK